MKKKHTLVMLPTEALKAFGLCIRRDNKKLLLYPSTKKDHDNAIYQHLYILSDEPIKEGDWCLCLSIHYNNLLPENKDNELNPLRQWNGGNCTTCKKIIATTDSSLKIWDSTCFSGEELYTTLPQLSKEFIQYFIEQYNKGNIITEVEVEYEEQEYCEEMFQTLSKSQLKVDKDNCISIVIKEADWEGVNNNYTHYVETYNPSKNMELNPKPFYQWLKENYNPPTKKT